MAGVGAGRDEREAWSPRLLPRPDGGRVIVLSMADMSSGVPLSWAAREAKPGVALLDGSINDCVAKAADSILALKTEHDFAIASVHWGPNWGYEISSGQFEFARKLIDKAGVDVVHGHSSHHPKQMALYRGRLIMFGCGDLLNDYEGIGGHDDFRKDLVALYLLTIDGARISNVKILPFRLRRFRLERTTAVDAAWLADRINHHSTVFKTAWVGGSDGTLRLALVP
jgi:poly-gamma-glutamate synthesis protein (capsule biosynthesis protein)